MSAGLRVPASEQDDRHVMAAAQAERLTALLARVHGRSGFYTRKFEDAGIDVQGPGVRGADLAAIVAQLPFTTKAEFVADQEAHRPWGTVLTEPLERYTRYNHTSGTTGRPLRWLDTNESWQWALECWKAVYRGARVTPADRIVFAFSFGPFLGFWTAFDAATQIGAHSIPAGGMSSQQRLALIEAVDATVVCCTPTYALRLAEVAGDMAGQPLAEGPVRVLIVAGEPGGSIPATRHRIEQAWGARVIDHHGLTEVGPISFECWEAPGALHLNEVEYICEVLDPATGQVVADGSPGELVVTNLGRTASPAIRYRTGDIVVRRSERCRCGRTLARLEGGVLGRADDMIPIRGVNIYPSAVEAIVRRHDDIVEFRSTVVRTGSLPSLSMEVEVGRGADAGAVVERLAESLRAALGLTVPVRAVEPGSLPRFEMKARRFMIESGTP